MSEGLPRSVQTRLVRHAKTLDVDPNLILTRYATERLLYRISRSRHADRFVLKGALMLIVWLGEMTRPTRDADLLGFGELDSESLAGNLVEICSASVEPDGLIFDTASIRVSPIRQEDPYGGRRATLLAYLGPARLRVQVDVGIGDAVSPEPVWIEYPSLLDFPRPRLLAYQPETAIAEKVHAMVTLGSINSRMRDFFDIDALASRQPFDGVRLAESLVSTFSRRGSIIPTEPPLALTPAFAAIEGKSAQWNGFLRKARLGETGRLENVIERIAEFLLPVFRAVGQNQPFKARWPPGGPWMWEA